MRLSERPGPPTQDRKCVLLVGMMGAGKSTVAGLLAGRLAWPVLDTDAVVEQRTGTPLWPRSSPTMARQLFGPRSPAPGGPGRIGGTAGGQRGRRSGAERPNRRAIASCGRQSSGCGPSWPLCAGPSRERRRSRPLLARAAGSGQTRPWSKLVAERQAVLRGACRCGRRRRRHLDAGRGGPTWWWRR